MCGCWRTLNSAENCFGGSHSCRALGDVATLPQVLFQGVASTWDGPRTLPCSSPSPVLGEERAGISRLLSLPAAGLGHLLLAAVGGVKGEQQLNLLHCSDYWVEPAPLPAPPLLLPTFCSLFQASVMLPIIKIVFLFQLLPLTTLLGEPLLRFCLLCVCALPFSLCPQESLCNVRRSRKKKTLEMKLWTTLLVSVQMQMMSLFPSELVPLGSQSPFPSLLLRNL